MHPQMSLADTGGGLYLVTLSILLCFFLWYGFPKQYLSIEQFKKPGRAIHLDVKNIWNFALLLQNGCHVTMFLGPPQSLSHHTDISILPLDKGGIGLVTATNLYNITGDISKYLVKV